ncbi:MAG: Gfo/Idh/MocA family oxidoreductase [Lachnospiraceae bacterium]
MKKVITYGTFDLFHEGHYKLLQRAKALGDYLIVGVTTEHFDEARGKFNVIDPIMKRIENVKNTGFADMIIVEDHEGQKIEDIQKYGVDIFTLGSDWVGAYDYLNNFCKVVYLERTPNISSTMLRGSTYNITKVGLVGTGRIAERFLAEARYASGMAVISAYNPDLDSVKHFKKKCEEYNISVETKDYMKFLQEVDSVYIASTHETHYEYAKLALGEGKHVLCEKPLAFTKAESEELYQLASNKGVVLMEAIKAAYCPGFQQLLNVVQSGKIGEIKDVEACFSRIAREESRERTDAMYGGAFLEYGGNALMPIIKILGKDYESVSFDCIDNQLGTDDYTKIQIRYKNAMATAKVGMAVKSEGQLIVAGTKGYVIAQSPWWLTQKFDVRYEDETIIEHYEPKFIGDGLRYEISEFMAKIHGVGEQNYKLTAGESIAITAITEEFVKKRGMI